MHAHTCMPTLRRAAACGAVLLAIGSPAAAQDATQQEVDDLRRELKEYRERSEMRMAELERGMREARAAAAAAEARLRASGGTGAPINSQDRPSRPGGSSLTETPEGNTGASPDPESSPGKRLEEGTDRSIAPPADAKPSFPDLPDQFEFHGYLRSGFGANGKGGDQEAFQAPGAFAKWRLGNEAETYGEAVFRYNFLPPSDTDATFATQVRIGFVTGNNSTFDSEDLLVIREAFGEGRNLVKALPGASFWAGNRFYQRQDIHINDFYFLDMSGYGGGVEDVKVGPFKAALAYIGSSADDPLTDNGRLAKQNLDFRLYDIPVPVIGGKGTVWLLYSYLAGGTDRTTGEQYSDADGPAVGFIHELEIGPKGFNKASIQYGYGSSSSLSAGGTIPPSEQSDASSIVRVTEQYTFQPRDWFAMQAAAVYQYRDTGELGDSDEHWLGVGARPMFFFTKHTGLAIEPGWDYVKSDAGDYEGSLYKFTVAPLLTIDRAFFGRPQLRLFYTYAWWDDDLVGRVGGSAHQNNAAGQSYGVQIESWW